MSDNRGKAKGRRPLPPEYLAKEQQRAQWNSAHSAYNRQEMPNAPQSYSQQQPAAAQSGFTRVNNPVANPQQPVGRQPVNGMVQPSRPAVGQYSAHSAYQQNGDNRNRSYGQDVANDEDSYQAESNSIDDLYNKPFNEPFVQPNNVQQGIVRPAQQDDRQYIAAGSSKLDFAGVRSGSEYDNYGIDGQDFDESYYNQAAGYDDDENQSGCGLSNGVKLGIIIGAGVLLIAVVLLLILKPFGKREQEDATLLSEMEAIVNVDTFYDGIYVDGVNLSGMTLEEAKQLFSSDFNSRCNEMKITLYSESALVPADGESVEASEESEAEAEEENDEEEAEALVPLEMIFTSQDMLVESDYEEILNEAYAIGRSGETSERYVEICALKNEYKEFVTTISVNIDAIRPKIEDLALSVYEEPVDATVEFTASGADRFKYTDEAVGIQLDVESVMENIENAVLSGKFGRILVEPEEVMPEVLKADLEECTSLLISKSTIIESDTAYINNVDIAARKVNGTMIGAGETFSFNAKVGELTEEEGYLEAPDYNSEYRLVDTLGAGVNQVATTVFMACAESGLTVTERRYGYVPATYCTKGLEAYTEYGYKDLKLTNNTDNPVYLRVSVSGSKVICEVYGKADEEGTTYSLAANVTKTVTPSEGQRLLDTTGDKVPEGEEEIVWVEGRNGYWVEVSLTTSVPGSSSKTQVLYTDYYSEVQEIVYYVEPEVTPTPEVTPEASATPATTPAASAEPTTTPVAEATPEPTPTPEA